MARTLTSVLTPLSVKTVRRVEDLHLQASPAKSAKRPKKEARVATKEVKKEKVVPRGKYLSAVVTSLLNLEEGKGSTKAAITARMKCDFPDLPWDTVSIVNRYVDMALKSGLDKNILVQQ